MVSISNFQQLSLLHKLESSNSVDELKQIHALIIRTGFPQTELLCDKIVSFLDSPRNETLHYAGSLIKHLKNPKVHQYNSIIKCLCRSSSKSSEAIALYKEMLGKDLLPNSYTIPYVLKACAQSRALRVGQQIHAYSIKTLLLSNVYVFNTLMRLYAVCGLIGAVHNLFHFHQGPQRDVVSWTTFIQAYVKMGYPREAIQTFFDMCQANLRPDGMILVIVLSACSKLGDIILGTKIHTYVHDDGLDLSRDVFVGNALVDMYLKCGNAYLACKVFDEMPVKNVVSWNSMIGGLAQLGEFKEALEKFQRMQVVGLKPDDVTLVCILNCCANLGLLELGQWVHAYADKNHIRADGFIGNALVDMYAKCGSIDRASWVFQNMNCRDVYSYTAMIVGLAMHGEAEKVLHIFSRMSTIGIEPDEVTFVGVLSACSHVGLVEEGRKYFADMSRVYNLKPQTEHYACMVDLFGRAGLIDEAVELIKDMPIMPDAFVWGALLGACKIHAKVELGEIVMEELVKVEPERDGAYMLMSNIYSSANRWEEALKLRKTMKERNMKKTPGCSTVEVAGEVHEFRKGDKSHPKSMEIYKLLEEMMSILKNYGYLAHNSEFIPLNIEME
ncbi:pentatricopeptide repeat-containing protein At1g08070, chloroplastic-like [Mangifera indica]|uniref:pentatricopeptide repeat-containing protein At1g08070, chloroplastic-like n=1 Tax=Mangifera indica TaxID=29780 RepID=UPI001CFB5CD3|nr:pentatricopeptide repeat-containing protein At1g08070, chloroplastic-like [Mangifera indica]